MSSQPDTPLTHHRRVILIAEDDVDQSDMLRETLEEEGYSVDTAFAGDSALKKLLEHDYGLILLDIRMPGLDGVSVLRRYQKERSGKKAPVVVLSAFATAAELASHCKAGAAAAYAKPYELNALLASIAELFAVEEQRK